jgi:hypothetical protein
MELNQEVAMEDDKVRWWVNHTVADKFFRQGFHSAYAISADGQTIRNIQSFSMEIGEKAAPHADYTCRKSTKDFRVDCDGTLMAQPIAYSVTYDRTNQLPSSVNGFDIISSLQTTAFRHAKRGIQVSVFLLCLYILVAYTEWLSSKHKNNVSFSNSFLYNLPAPVVGTMTSGVLKRMPFAHAHFLHSLT